MGKISFTAGKDQVRTYIKLKDAVAELRGFDLAGSKRGPKVPRTTNADIKILVARWTDDVAFAMANALGKGQKKALPAMKKIAAKWRRTADSFLKVAERNPPDAIFAENARFWNATKRLAIDLNSIKAFSGAPWEFTLKDLGDAVIDAPRVIAKAVKGGAKATGRAATAIARGAGEAAGGFLSGAGIPLLLLVGVGVYAATRKKR